MYCKNILFTVYSLGKKTNKKNIQHKYNIVCPKVKAKRPLLK